METKVRNYVLKELIGEGTFGVVRKSISIDDRKEYAVKVVSKKNNSQALEKEILIHKSVSAHPNVVKLYEVFEESDTVYMVMELAEGGELFDKIELDVGIDEQLAHFYFLQLISVIEYLHSQGICHRDLKPENLLLDKNGNLKLSDFGFSTLFEHKGKRRKLATQCGSSVYMAPEIFVKPYDGDKIDIWSCGIILFVLLCGEIPWNKPLQEDKNFQYFFSNGAIFPPWNRFSPQVLDLLTRVLSIIPENRVTLAEIKQHPWFSQPNSLMLDGQSSDPQRLFAKFIQIENSGDEDMDLALTQPEAMCTQEVPANFNCFSQPEKDAIEMSQAMITGSQKWNWQSCARLMRFFTELDEFQVIERIKNIFNEMLVPHKIHAHLSFISFATVDSRKCPVVGQVRILVVPRSGCLVVFKKHRGDPLEFKRFFAAILESVSDIIKG